MEEITGRLKLYKTGGQKLTQTLALISWMTLKNSFGSQFPLSSNENDYLVHIRGLWYQ